MNTLGDLGPAGIRSDLLVCHDCDAVHARPVMGHEAVARCRRCGATLAYGAELAPESQLALAIAAAVVFAIASLSPIVTLELRGVDSQASLFEATWHTWRSGEHLVALLAFCTAFVFPATVIVLRLWVLLPAALQGRPAAGLVRALRALRWVTRWSMVEVFMLGILIAVVRSAGVTDVVLGAGIFAYAMLTVLLTAMQASGLHGLWPVVETSA